MKFSEKFATLKWLILPLTSPLTSARNLSSRIVVMMFQKRKFVELSISQNVGQSKSHMRSVCG